MNKTNPPQRPKRAQRSDGRSTRAIVLEAAGKVFAERGFAEATSKEICAGGLSEALPEGVESWLGIAAAFDAVFLAAGLVLFPFVFSGDE